MALSSLNNLSIAPLRNLDIEAYEFYDITLLLNDAALPTMCYSQHPLQPYIDSEISHIKHLIKVQFVNKGIKFIR